MATSPITLAQEDSNPLPYLPQEIINLILLRLPVKSLLKFRCVCKPWLSLISSSDFIKTHLKYAPNHSKYALHRLLLLPTYNTLYTCSLSSALYEPSVVGHFLDYPWQDPDTTCWVLGACNGLFCLYIYKDSIYDKIILWNPSTRKIKKLPYSPPAPDDASIGYVSYAFGYDVLNDDYKVLETCGYTCDYRDEYINKMIIYSTRAKEWKQVQDCPGEIELKSPSVSLNGAFHWRDTTYGHPTNDSTEALVLLNMEMLTFRWMELPDDNLEKFGSKLDIVDGHLSEWRVHYENRIDIWVMKEYGAANSWEKLISVPYPALVGTLISPLFVSKSGEILFQYGTSLVAFSSRENIFRTPEIPVLGDYRVLPAASYIESLLSPDVDDNI